MDFHVTWGNPLPLINQHNRPYTLNDDDWNEIPNNAPGIYMFIRIFGNNKHVLYIGKATNLRNRIAQQFNNASLMEGIRNAPNGARNLIVGRYYPNQGAQINIMLPKIELALIRHYLELGHPLLNIHGANIAYDVIISEGVQPNGLIPNEIYFEHRN